MTSALKAQTGLGSSHYFETASNAKLDEIKKLLDSRENKDKLDGMKRLIAVCLTLRFCETDVVADD
jgi:hypothetical protein